jgi:cytochrome c oxidase subunit II
MILARRVMILLFPASVGGCSGWQSALDPQGPQANHLAQLIWGFTIVCAVVFLLVMAALAFALMRRTGTPADPLAQDPLTARRSVIVVGASVAATGLIVLALTGWSYYSQKQIYSPDDAALTIQITGQQWWWQIRYEDHQPDQTFTTANEIHIPVGVPVKLKLKSSDVIHSFWVPSLAGKRDLIPGQDNELHVSASRPGVYRGQCAEFCGIQHAHMSLLVIAEPPEEFERWRQSQIASADEPDDDDARRGRDAFLSKPCVMCHAVQGTLAGGRVGPDLTHVGSRRYIGAGILPLSRGNLAAWIVDPHGIKPGVNMPTIKLEPDDINAIAAYLEGLK